MPQQEQPEVHRRGTRHEVDEDVGVRVRLHPDRQLVGKIADCLLGAFTEHQVRVISKLQPIAKVPDEVATLVHRWAEPDELAIVEHGIEEHDALDHASLRGGFPETVVGLADGRPERLVVDVKHPTAMELSGGDRRRESPLDERLDEVRTLLAVDDAGEAAVPGARRIRRSAGARSTESAPDAR